METYQYVVIGGGLAGGQAVEGIREEDATGTIALVTQEPHRPYHRPPLSKGYLMGQQEESEVYLAPADRYAKDEITLLTGIKAVGINRAAKTVSLDNGKQIGYEKLLLAMGGTAKRLPLPGHELGNVFTLRTIEDSDQIQTAAGKGKHALVLGGSFIGSEVAASLTMTGTKVTMAFPESRLLERVVPEAMSTWLHHVYADEGVTVLAGVTPDALSGEGDVERVRLSNGDTLDIDLVVMGVGIRLNTGLAESLSLTTRSGDQAVVVNEYLRTDDPDIYAAGDIAAWPEPTFDKQLRVEHWDVAYNQGHAAGRNMAGAGEPYDHLPYFFSDLFDLSFEVWGDLGAWDQTVQRGSLEDRAVAFYYFNDGELVGVLAMGRPDEEREPMQALIKAGVTYDDVAQHLEDEGTDLADLVES